MQDFRRAADHVRHDVSGRANVVNQSHRLTDENGSRVEILCGNSFFEGSDRFR